MSRDVFGSKDANRGGKVPSQREWNELNNALTNINVGGRFFEFADVNGDGTNMPSDSFFFPHIAGIKDDYITGIIGTDREEEWYPYVDSLSIEKRTEIWYFTLDNGEYKKFQGVNVTSNKTRVLFKTANEKEPIKPADVNDSAVIGYKWSLVPTITDVTFSAGDTEMAVTIVWEADQDFDTDTQKSLFTKDTGDTEEDWGAQTKKENVGTYDGEGLINTWLNNESAPQYPIDISDASETILDDWLFDLVIQVPVAAYDWNQDGQTELVRVVQLQFGLNCPTLSASIGQSESTTFDHPFKARLNSTNDYIVEVGYLRPTWKDSITIEDPETDFPYEVEYTAQENLDLSAESGYPTDYYVYYDIYKNGSAWTSVLSASNVWPPDAETGNVLIQIGYADYDSGSTSYTWYQHLYDTPRESIQTVRDEFEAYYELNGSVTIEAGYVECFETGGPVNGTTLSLGTPTDVWIEVTSTASATTPSLAINPSLQTGSFPGIYTSVSDAVKKFSYKIGEITIGETYEPSHKGRVQIDNTLLQPLITDAYENLVNAPRMMEYHSSQPTTVGLNTNEDLIYAKFLDVQVRGGGVYQMKEGTDVRIYGKSDDDVFNHIASVDTDTADEVTFNRKEIDFDFDRGLMQKFDDSAISDFVLRALGKWVGIEVGGRIYHKNSPGSTEAWTSHTLSLSGGGSVTLYFDNKGHLWKYDTTEQPEVENYRYTHCSDSASYPDLIFASQQANTVIEVDGECYEHLATTEEDATSPVPTVTATYSTCALCTGAATNEQWKKCSDDSNAAVLSPAHTDVDYAWLCLSSAYVKCYNANNTSSTATDPTVLKQCDNAAPASCSDLVGWPTSDSFSDTNCDSGSVGDTNWNIRWVEDTTSLYSISGGSLSIALPANHGSDEFLTPQNDAVAGAFAWKMNVSSFPSVPGSGTQEQFILLIADVGGTVFYCGFQNAPATSSENIIYRDPNFTSQSRSANSGLFEIRRDGSNNVSVWFGGAQLGSTSTASGNATFKIETEETTGNAFTTKLSSITLNDNSGGSGSGNDIRIDPSGDSCT